MGIRAGRFRLTESADDPEDVTLSVAPGNRGSLNHFENVAKTVKWLGDEGAAADAVSQQHAHRALELAEDWRRGLERLRGGRYPRLGGTVQTREHWIDFHLP